MNDNINLHVIDEHLPDAFGSRNEAGFVSSLDRQGFTPTKCGAEMIANFIDAFASDGIFVLGDGKIKLIDTGIGMTTDKLSNMFDAGRANHCGDQSMGVSGIGGIISNYQFSKDDNGRANRVVLWTKHTTGSYLGVNIPWQDIFATKKYDKQIKPYLMSEEEINIFNSERPRQVMPSGTTIIFPYSETIRNLLTSQFVPKQNDCSTFDAWWSVIFGKTLTNISLECNSGIPSIQLKKYDYFGDASHNYYCGKNVYEIFHIHDNGRDRFICIDPVIKEKENRDQYIEIIQTGVGFSTIPKPTRVDPREIENADVITYTNGMRKDNQIFDPKKPADISATFSLNPYDAEFMVIDGQKDIIKDFCSKIAVYRNNQRITGFALEGYNINSSRANGDLLMKMVLHRSEISYKTLSTQDNRLDIIHGIQQNKNQNQNEFPKQYVRLIKYLKEYDYERHKTYFNNVITNHKKELAEKQRIVQELKRAEELRVATERQRILEEQRLAEEQLLAQDSDDDSEAEEESEEESEAESEAEEDAESEEAVEEEESEEAVAEEEEESEEAEAEEEAEEETIVKISNSKEWEKQAAQALMMHITEVDYNKTNGKEIYDLVMEYINKK